MAIRSGLSRYWEYNETLHRMLRRFICILVGVAMPLLACSQARKVQNRPYIDQRRVHYGFVIGLHMQDFEFGNNGFVTEDGQTWFADVAEYSPGFTVGVLGELYLNKYFALRLIPSLDFGDKRIIFREQNTGEEYRQTMKSCYISVPLSVKYAAERFNNYRPYLMAGIAPSVDLGKRRQQALRTKSFDCAIEIGLGCDFYLPFFKLIPELKFRFGLANLLEKKRDDLTDLSLLKYTQSLDAVGSRMIILSFYFE